MQVCLLFRSFTLRFRRRRGGGSKLGRLLRNLRWRAAAAAFFYKGAICKAPLRIKRAPWRPGVIFDAHFLFLLLFSLRGKRRGEGEEGSSDRNLGVEDDRLDRKIEIVTLHFVCPDHSYIGTNTRKAIHRQGGTEKGPRG